MVTASTGINLVLIVLLITERTTAQSHAAQYNVLYGLDPKQIMDIYIPGTTDGRAILLLHGGGWEFGTKHEMNQFLGFLMRTWPSVLVADIDYRLGSMENPGYPMQLEDIHSAIGFLNQNVTGNSNLTFTLLGTSAGGHLSLLYSYLNAQDGNVKAIVNIVGPTDFTDPPIVLDPLYQIALFPFVGPQFYFQNPSIYNETSPVAWVTPNSPPTISFYGETDPIIPISQGPRLHRKLNATGTPNELTFYSGSHYFNWAPMDIFDMTDKISRFLNKYF